MTFASLKTDVENAIARGDVPAFVYALVTADINRDMRLMEMLSETTLTVAAETVSLPADFLEVEAAWLDASPRRPLRPAKEMATATRHDASGEPFWYAVTGSEIRFMPVPSGSYDVYLRYYARLSDLSADGDTNDVLVNYPSLYHYGSCAHAAVWAQDDALMQTYATAYGRAVEAVKTADRKRRLGGGPLMTRPAVTGF